MAKKEDNEKSLDKKLDEVLLKLEEHSKTLENFRTSFQNFETKIKNLVERNRLR